MARKNSRLALRNHHDGHHEAGDPLGVYMPPLMQWRTFGCPWNATTFDWKHPTLGWNFHVTRKSYGSNAPGPTWRGFVTDPNADPTLLLQVSSEGKESVYGALRSWYAALDGRSAIVARSARSNPDWHAIRTRGSELAVRARGHASDALEWSKPRVRAAAAATRDAAVRGYEWTKPRAKAAAARTAELAREGYAYVKPRAKAAAEATGRAVKRGSKDVARRAGESLSAYAARENTLRNSAAMVRGTKALGARLAKWRDVGPSKEGINPTSAAFKAGRRVSIGTAKAARNELQHHVVYFRQEDPALYREVRGLIRDLGTRIRGAK